MVASLNGKIIAYVEARMRSEMGSLIQRNGGTPYSAPVLQEIYLKDSPEVHQLVQDICSGTVEIVVCLTGVGTRALIETAAAMDRQEEFLRCLDQRMVIARSPKPARVLRQHKIHIDIMPPEPYTSEDLIAAVSEIDLQDRELAVQAYGSPNGFLTKGLSELGARVREVTLYNWGLPEDLSPVAQMINDLDRGKIDALAFTSQPQAGNLMAIAAQIGSEGSLRERLNSPSVVVASVGPVCTRGLSKVGINVDVEPDHPHMGNLIQALAKYLEQGPVSLG